MKVLPFKTQPKSSLFLKLEPTHDGEGTFVVVCDSSGRVYQNGRILLITERGVQRMSCVSAAITIARDGEYKSTIALTE
jgi:hypothetical protein